MGDRSHPDVGSIEALQLPSTWPGFRRRVRQTDRRVCGTRKPTCRTASHDRNARTEGSRYGSLSLMV